MPINCEWQFHTHNNYEKTRSKIIRKNLMRKWSFWWDPHCVRPETHFNCTITKWNDFCLQGFKGAHDILFIEHFFLQRLNRSSSSNMVGITTNWGLALEKKQTFSNSLIRTNPMCPSENKKSLPHKLQWEYELAVKLKLPTKLVWKNNKQFKSYPDVCHHCFGSVKID